MSKTQFVNHSLLTACLQRTYPGGPIYNQLLSKIYPNVLKHATKRSVLEVGCAGNAKSRIEALQAHFGTSERFSYNVIDHDPDLMRNIKDTFTENDFFKNHNDFTIEPVDATVSKTVQDSEIAKSVESGSKDIGHVLINLHGHFYDDYHLKKIFANSNDFILRKAGEKSPDFDKSIIFSSWEPLVEENCALTRIVRFSVFHEDVKLNFNTPHQKPFKTYNYYPHNLKEDSAEKQRELFNELLYKKGFEEPDYESGVCEVDLSDLKRVISEEESADYKARSIEGEPDLLASEFPHLDSCLFGKDRTFGDVNRLLFSQSDETEAIVRSKVNEVLKDLVAEKEAGKTDALTIKKRFVVAKAGLR